MCMEGETDFHIRMEEGGDFPNQGTSHAFRYGVGATGLNVSLDLVAQASSTLAVQVVGLLCCGKLTKE